MSETEEYKRQAAERAVEYVKPGMVLGLGSGSTAMFAVRGIARLLKEGSLKDIVCIPSSLETESEARTLGIPLATFDTHPSVDLTIDGADEVDPRLSLIKGGGGALLREKVLAQTSRMNVIIVDESKLSPMLGTLRPLPVQVLPLALRPEEMFLKSLGAVVKLRTGNGDTPFVTEQGHYILDCSFGPIRVPLELASRLDQRAGIIGHGLFLGLANEVIVAGKSGISSLKHGAVSI